MDTNVVDTQKRETPKVAKAKPSKPKNNTIFVLAGFLVLAIVTAGYFFWQWNTLRNNPAISGAEESKDLVEEIGKIMLLPDGELPTVATVTDPSALADQVFFANAQVGYKVLVYSLAKKAVLYDPVNHRIIEVGPISVSDAPVDEGTTTDTKEETN